MVGGLDLPALERAMGRDRRAERRRQRAADPEGIELNIADDGSVDYDEDVLAKFEIALASLHSGWDQDEATATKRLLSAISNPGSTSSPIRRVASSAAETPSSSTSRRCSRRRGRPVRIMEINTYPDRLDLSAEHIRLARDLGVRFSLGTDAHAADQLPYMRYGVAQARRGMVTRDELHQRPAMGHGPHLAQARQGGAHEMPSTHAEDVASEPKPPFDSPARRLSMMRSSPARPLTRPRTCSAAPCATDAQGMVTAGPIVETEAYLGRDDAGSHAATKQ